MVVRSATSLLVPMIVASTKAVATPNFALLRPTKGAMKYHASTTEMMQMIALPT
jgi:hypothetical protein